MARDFAKFSSSFWMGRTGKKLRGCLEAQVLAAYLISGPHANMLGLYYIPLFYAAHETGMTLEQVQKGLELCVAAGFCAYDKETECVWVYAMARYQLGEKLLCRDKRCRGAQLAYAALPFSPFLSDFFDTYAEDFHLEFKREEPIEGASKDLKRDLEGASEGLQRSIEDPPKQEKETEKEKETETDKETETEKEVERRKRSANPAPPVGYLLSRDKGEWPYTQTQVDAWQKAFPALPLEQELCKMRLWLEANPERRKTFRGMGAFVLRWLSCARKAPVGSGKGSGQPGRAAEADKAFLDQLRAMEGQDEFLEGA